MSDTTNTLSLEAQLAALKAENEALKAKVAPKLGLKLTEKGGTSVYGLGRFPVTLYKEQWEKLAARMPDILKFQEDNAAEIERRSAAAKAAAQ